MSLHHFVKEAIAFDFVYGINTQSKGQHIELIMSGVYKGELSYVSGADGFCEAWIGLKRKIGQLWKESLPPEEQALVTESETKFYYPVGDRNYAARFQLLTIIYREIIHE